ncbi:MAG: DUF5343 domain-containing protein [Pseudomonadota bacterium]
MALTAKYLVAQNNVASVFDKIISGAVPDKFTLAHLRGLGFTSSNDRGFLGILKELGFLTEDGTPTQRYKDFRDRSRSKSVMAEALLSAYGDLFLIDETNLGKKDREAIVGKFKSTHGSNDNVAGLQASTFLSLLELADMTAGRHPVPAHYDPDSRKKPEEPEPEKPAPNPRNIDLRYTIQIHLPESKDMEVYNAIFKSIRQNLLDE